ncbi:hypothetical protein BDK51DRAFT_42903 [Blyttiomyces helicus]|uniref:Uncharacterized protein n=1 Tax=Blyttiomyces helicus TaxID=388810 RepID=A0A4P9WMP1_9FUNG|nr:hypothetical protein BDK51DRAFT_42903 [Blyttiomyces helicus]|eukprot:RKO94351.1 hypothetical protein BDK51DRAFT_42903 [Blyttiomyces helicus]
MLLSTHILTSTGIFVSSLPSTRTSALKISNEARFDPAFIGTALSDSPTPRSQRAPLTDITTTLNTTVGNLSLSAVYVEQYLDRGQLFSFPHPLVTHIWSSCASGPMCSRLAPWIESSSICSPRDGQLLDGRQSRCQEPEGLSTRKGTPMLDSRRIGPSRSSSTHSGSRPTRREGVGLRGYGCYRCARYAAFTSFAHSTDKAMCTARSAATTMAVEDSQGSTTTPLRGLQDGIAASAILLPPTLGPALVPTRQRPAGHPPVCLDRTLAADPGIQRQLLDGRKGRRQEPDWLPTRTGTSMLASTRSSLQRAMEVNIDALPLFIVAGTYGHPLNQAPGGGEKPQVVAVGDHALFVHSAAIVHAPASRPRFGTGRHSNALVSDDAPAAVSVSLSRDSRGVSKIIGERAGKTIGARRRPVDDALEPCNLVCLTLFHASCQVRRDRVQVRIRRRITKEAIGTSDRESDRGEADRIGPEPLERAACANTPLHCTYRSLLNGRS